MVERREPLITDVTKHKKKSASKGQPRSKHKHIYETVLLAREYHTTDFKTGKPKVCEESFPTKVCAICGRIDDIDWDESYYIKKLESPGIPGICYPRELSEKAFKLPKWYTADFFAKFASKVE